MMISCDEAADICNKKQYKEASWWQVQKLRFHILICKTCNLYSTKNTKFTSLCEKAKLQVISNEDKEAMKKELEKKL
ncbi:hypothetical protein [uncultured Croceitalea sp.]|uniref:hypothetical protein n=1 Tax=uncultured Croceitalea sp. TaxID=1798908 RepID=UPI0033058289